jgi:hypothetical protein
MKKFALLAVVAVAAVGAGVAGNALASGTPTIIASASGFPCNVFDRDGSLFTTTNSSSVVFASGKEVLHCTGQGTPGDTIVTQSGFACGLFFGGVSTDPANSSRVGRNGESQLTCYGHGVTPTAAAAGPAGAQG